MARIRSIKPEFWKSESIAALPRGTRLTFIGLWQYVDDNGVGRDVEKLIAAELYPLEQDPSVALEWIREELATLSRASRIIRYTVAGKRFLAISNWSEHQKIDRPNKARYPTLDDPEASLTCGNTNARDTLATPSRHPRADPASGAVELGSSGTGEQGSSKPSPSSLRDDDPNFTEFWRVYPRKVGKQAARKAYSKARRRVEPGVILVGALHYRDDPNREDQFTAHPASWLNDGRWDDDPLPSRLRAIPDRVGYGDDVLDRAAARARAAEQTAIGES